MGGTSLNNLSDSACEKSEAGPRTKAAFTLTPAESKRLIAKGIVAMPEMQAALKKAYVILNGGTTNAFVAQELLGRAFEPARCTVGLCVNGLLCHTEPEDRLPFPIILYQGEEVKKTIREVLDDYRRETVIVKGGNAIDPEGNVGVITSGFDGGTVAALIGTATSQGVTWIAGVGLEKLVPSVKEAALCTGAKTFDYSMGVDFGMYHLVHARAVTEITAFKILFDVEAKFVSAGGIGGSEGAVVLVVEGQQENMQRAIALVESIKGEPAVAGIKGNCAICRYACCYAGKVESELPGWMLRR